MKNIFSNVKYGMLSQIVKILLQFVNRKVFLYILGVELLGVHSLFTSIISLLSMTELGMGAAVAYSLYKPLADNDMQKVAGIMCLYKKVYRIIGCVIFAIGLCLIPFIPNFVNTPSPIPNLRLMFFIILLKCSFTYLLFAYSQTLLIASECKYKVDRIILLFNVITSIGEVSVLLLTHNYILFLCVEMFGLITQQFLIYRETKAKFPVVMNSKGITLDVEEKNKLWKNVYGLSITKFAGAVLGSIDNIIISSFLSTAIVGYYANYSLIQTAAVSVISIAFVSITANIGHKFANNTIEEKHLFELLLIDFFICILSVTLYCTLISDFISLFFSPDLVLGKDVVSAIGLNMAITYMGLSIQVFKDASGIFWYGKYRPVVTCLLNILFSLLLVAKLGIAGVVFATCLSRILTTLCFDPYLVYKYAFNKSCLNYFKKYFYFISLIFLSVLLNWLIFEHVIQTSVSFVGFSIKTFVAVILTAIVAFVGTVRMTAFKDVSVTIMKKFRK